MTQTSAQPAVAVIDRRPVAARPLLRDHRIRVAALATAMVLVHLTLAAQYWHVLRFGSYDLVIFDQAVRSYASFQLPVALVKGVHHGFGPDFNILGDHFSPALALLAPLYWIWDDPRMLLVGQALLLAAGLPVVWRFTRRELGTRAAYLVAAAYAVCWPLQGATSVGLHEVAFAVPLVALLLERARAGRLGQAALAGAGLLLVKEDLGLLVAAFGMFLLVRPATAGDASARNRRLTGVGLVLGGLAAVYLTSQLLIPAFGGRADQYWTYTELGADPASALLHVVTDPLHTLQVFFTPWTKTETMLWLFLGAGGALCLASPTVLLVLPLLALRMFSAKPDVWETTQHYNAFLAPILLFAGVEAVARLRTRWRPLLRVWVVGLLAVTPVAMVVAKDTVVPFRNLFLAAEWGRTPANRALVEAAALVPAGALVEADNYAGPYLSGRARVLLLDCQPRGAEWVLSATDDRPRWPFENQRTARARLALALAQGYRPVFRRDQVTLLRRDPGAGPPPARPVCRSW